jgi:hypothetical protein
MKRRNIAIAVSSLLIATAVFAGSENWSNPGIWGQGAYARVGDFDGDGRDDFFTFAGTYQGFYSSNGVNAFTGVWKGAGNSCYPAPPPYGNPEWIRVGDVDGDGRDEYVSPSGGTAYIYGWDAGWAPCLLNNTASINSSWGNSQFTWGGDFNGDGYGDIASQYFNDIYMKFGNASLSGGSGSFGSATWAIAGPWGQAAYTKVGDFNGDGLTDIASLAGGNAYMKINTGSGFTSVTWSISNLWMQGAYTFAGDFNADGLDDIASCGGGTCYMKQSTGSGFIDPGNISIDPSWGNPEWTFVGDFEGDGNDDIASAYGNQTFMKLISN